MPSSAPARGPSHCSVKPTPCLLSSAYPVLPIGVTIFNDFAPVLPLCCTASSSINFDVVTMVRLLWGPGGVALWSPITVGSAHLNACQVPWCYQRALLVNWLLFPQSESESIPRVWDPGIERRISLCCSHCNLCWIGRRLGVIVLRHRLR